MIAKDSLSSRVSYFRIFVLLFFFHFFFLPSLASTADENSTSAARECIISSSLHPQAHRCSTVLLAAAPLRCSTVPLPRCFSCSAALLAAAPPLARRFSGPTRAKSVSPVRRFCRSNRFLTGFSPSGYYQQTGPDQQPVPG
jgi:hypothetical protein